MLSLVVLFISVVCLIISNRNDKIISGATIGETDASQEVQANDNVSTPVTDENGTQAIPDTTITIETTKPPAMQQKKGVISNNNEINVMKGGL